MTASEQKEARERLMFGGFAACSGQEIDPPSITSCAPPLPDIRCTINGSTYFFELAEVVPPKQAQALAIKGVYTYGFPDPDDAGPKAMEAIIRQKQNKVYETRGAPVDLPPVLQQRLPHLPPRHYQHRGRTNHYQPRDPRVQAARTIHAHLDVL